MTRQLQTISPEIIPILHEALAARDRNGLLEEAQSLLAHPGHDRMNCTCPPCHLYRRIRTHLRRDS